VPKHWKDIANLYLIRYEDQLRIIGKIGVPFDAETEIERQIKSQNEEFFVFYQELDKFNDKQLQTFLTDNLYPRQEGKPLKVKNRHHLKLDWQPHFNLFK
jgi:hypothetical protein